MLGRNRSSRVLRLLLGVLLALVVQAVGILLWFSTSQATTQQPVAFNHEVMVEAGLTCLFCHADAIRSPSAGFLYVTVMEVCLAVMNSFMP